MNAEKPITSENYPLGTEKLTTRTNDGKGKKSIAVPIRPGATEGVFVEKGTLHYTTPIQDDAKIN